MTETEIKARFAKELKATEDEYHGLDSLNDRDVQAIAARFYNAGRQAGFQEAIDRLTEQMRGIKR